MNTKLVIPPLHPYLQQLRDYTSTYPIFENIWERFDIHRRWAQVEVNFERERWVRELTIYEQLEINSLTRERDTVEKEITQVKARDAAGMMFREQRLAQLDEIEKNIQARREKLTEYRKTFEEICALQEEVLKDKKDIQLISSIVPLPHYLIAFLSGLVGLYYLFRQPVKHRVESLRGDIVHLKEEVVAMKAELAAATKPAVAPPTTTPRPMITDISVQTSQNIIHAFHEGIQSYLGSAVALPMEVVTVGGGFSLGVLMTILVRLLFGV
eukprot:PhF_6_TR20699/c0_g1_i2/m.29776